jgi:hypothetical protein
MSLLGLAGLAVASGTGLAVMYWCQWASPAQVEATLTSLKPWFFVWRLLVFGGVILLWDKFIAIMARWWDLNAVQTFRLLEARWQVALWLVALELALGQNVVGQFFRALGQAL